MNEMVIIGKTVSTFGIKGELKVISDFEKKELAFVTSKKVLINNIEYEITGVRYHKNYVLLEINNLKNINDVLDLVGFNIYMKREDLGLKESEFLYSDLIGKEVREGEDILGTVEKIEVGPRYNYIKVLGDKPFLIPLIPEYFLRYDAIKKIIYTKNAKDLIL